jgi:ABC-type dipeptide/oligopeptide/nickel transport system ATPase component
MAERIAVMQHGRIVELADIDRLWSAPEHPYTRQLLASLPPDL